MRKVIVSTIISLDGYHEGPDKNEMGQLQERITSTRGQSITSMPTIYVPADDYTDPGEQVEPRFEEPTRAAGLGWIELAGGAAGDLLGPAADTVRLVSVLGRFRCGRH